LLKSFIVVDPPSTSAIGARPDIKTARRRLWGFYTKLEHYDQSGVAGKEEAKFKLLRAAAKPAANSPADERRFSADLYGFSKSYVHRGGLEPRCRLSSDRGDLPVRVHFA
jgi:hypothetical protein